MDNVKWPSAVLHNLSKALGVDEKGAEYYARNIALSIVNAYTVRGTKYFWTQVDAQVLAALLDRRNAKLSSEIKEFQAYWGTSALEDLAASEQVTERMKEHETAALSNLPLWLWYALCKYKRLSEWQAYNELFAERMDTQTLMYLITPLLKDVSAQAKAIAKLVIDERERKQPSTDATRVNLRQLLMDDAVSDTDYAVRDMLFDAMYRADITVLKLKTLDERLRHMRDSVKVAYFERTEQEATQP